MELKTARLTLLIDPNKKAAFERLCAQLDMNASQVVRQMIRDFLAQHGVTYEPSGLDEAQAAAATPPPRTAVAGKRGAAAARMPPRPAGARRKG